MLESLLFLNPYLCESESCSVMSNSLRAHDYTVHGILQARTLEQVAFPFSRGSSQPRDRTQISRIAGRFFTSWATRETPLLVYQHKINKKFVTEWSFGEKLIEISVFQLLL